MSLAVCCYSCCCSSLFLRMYFLWIYQREHQRFYIGQSNQFWQKSKRKSCGEKKHIELVWNQKSLRLQHSVLPTCHRCVPHEETESSVRSLHSFYIFPKVRGWGHCGFMLFCFWLALQIVEQVVFQAFHGGAASLAVFPPAEGFCSVWLKWFLASLRKELESCILAEALQTALF